MPDPSEQPAPVECASPPCMLHELDTPAAPHGGAATAVDEWADVRLWRKAKRQVLIERRLAIGAEDRVRHDATITTTLAGLLATDRDRLIGFYWPFRGEYDPRPLVRSLHAGGVRLALPVVVTRAAPLVFRTWWPGMPMSHGIWNIPVPAEGDPVAPDVLLVPLVGFDGARYRLGYGGGYYDRTLASCCPRPRTIGIGYAGSRIRTIHPQPHDIPMDVIVSEAGSTP